MIKVRDWIASIPDEEKHIAYVGEGKSEQREFLLCGDGWKTYRDWSFHLDMAFDPTTITTHDSRQVVQTTVNSTEHIEETSVTTDEVTTKETYTVNDVQVTNHNLTDIAPLSKAVTTDGIRLTWTVLRQHTVLPGKLWATIRAMDGEAQRIKKSAIMVFEVDPAICAVPATVPPISEFEQMTAQMDALRLQTEAAADMAVRASNNAAGAANDILDHLETVQKAADETASAASNAVSAADEAIRASTTATIAADGALGNLYLAVDAANKATAAVNDAVASADEAIRASTTATIAADAALGNMQLAIDAANAAQAAKQTVTEHTASAALSVQGAQQHANTALHAAAEAKAAAQSILDAEYNRINVRDYGAKGDGVADDRAAIIAAFDAAKSMLPCEVYFPAGTYGISNGITVNMALGTGGLLIRGAGWNTTTIKYLESYNPRQTDIQWHAIRIWPMGMPNTKPTTEDDYLHDICITGLSVYDTDPCAHAIHPDKGDSAKEETHGFGIQYCKRVSITDCKMDSVGDEAVDIFACHDVMVTNNHIVHSPAAGSSGGAVFIGGCSKNVIVSGNTINGTAEDETLENGTVINKSNFGIAVECVATPIADVIVTGNTIKSVRGSGVHFSAQQTGASIANLSITDNIISDCTNGIVAIGNNSMDGLKIHNNTIAGCSSYSINLAGSLGDVTIVGNTIRNAGYGAKVVQLSSRQLFADNLFENIYSNALYVRGQTMVKNCVFKDVGTTVAAAAIFNDVSSTTNGTLVVSGCTMMGIRTKSAIYGAQTVRDTDIEFVDENGNVVYTHNVFGGSKDCFLRDLSGGNIGGRVEIQVNNSSVFGAKLTYTGSTANAIQLNANKARVIGCFIDANNGNYCAISEKSGVNHNLIANNIVNKAIVTNGAQSVAVNNINTSATA